jgi:hypothetical protein
MSKNLAVFLCIVLADLAVVSTVGSSIEQMAYAKNLKVSNVQVTNSNVLHNNNNNNKKNSIDSNCPGALSEIRDDRLSQRVDDGISALSLSSSSSSSSSSKTLSSCSDPISFNSCRKLDVSHSLTSTPPIDKTVKDSSITKDTAPHLYTPMTSTKASTKRVGKIIVALFHEFVFPLDFNFLKI